jgi:hypothetical protein
MPLTAPIGKGDSLLSSEYLGLPTTRKEIGGGETSQFAAPIDQAVTPTRTLGFWVNELSAGVSFVEGHGLLLLLAFGPDQPMIEGSTTALASIRTPP